MKANRPVGAPRRALFSAVRHPVRSILLIGVCFVDLLARRVSLDAGRERRDPGRGSPCCCR